VRKFGFNRSKASKKGSDSSNATGQKGKAPSGESRRRRPKKIVRQLTQIGDSASQTVRQVGRSAASLERKLPGPLRSKLGRRLGIAALISLGLVGLGRLSYWQIDRSMPPTSRLNTFLRRGTITIKALDGSILQQSGDATRERVTIDKMPETLANAFIAAEDRRFYQHDGVDYTGIVRAMARNVSSGGLMEGGSTITQQLARMAFLNQDRSLIRKVKEAILAQRLERDIRDKRKLLEHYLNLVYLGSEAYGVADAAWVYFGKTIDQLTIGESAMIAGLPPAPTQYSPIVNPDIAKERRTIVLERMLEQGFINPEQASQAKAEPLNLKKSTPKNLYSNGPYFTDYVMQELPNLISKEDMEAGGLVIETTLNARWQKAAEKAVQETIKYDGAYSFDQASLVSIDPNNGEIRAMVGGYDYYKDSQFNRVTQAQRQPGSTFKPFVYLSAIAAGFSPYKAYQDAPFFVDGYEPKNFGNSYSGTLDMKQALTKSANVVAVKILIDVGFDPVITMAKNMGVQSKLEPTYSMALGAYEVNLLELTSGYGTFAAQGMHVKPHGIRRVTNALGEVLYSAEGKDEFKSKRVVDPGSTAIMTWMLENVVNNGTGQPAILSDRAVAGKTGTSEKARDLWFIGFIPQIVTGVWLGNDDSGPTGGSSSTAAATWHAFMKEVVKEMPVAKFPEIPKDLDERKGSIKAKPVKPDRSYTRAPSAEEERSSRRRDRSEERYEPAPEPAYEAPRSGGGDYYREPEPARAEDIPPPANNYYEPPPPEPAPAPEPEPEPVAPPPAAREPEPPPPEAAPEPPPP
jgi:penicillin-binding protein 1A